MTGLQPLQIAATLGCILAAAKAQSFTQAEIGQNAPFTGASNLLTVTLVSDISLPHQTAVALSGLASASSGSSSTVSLLSVTGGNSGHLLFGSQALWNAGIHL